MCFVGRPQTHWLRSLRRTLRLVTVRAPSVSGLVLQRRPLTWATGEAKPAPAPRVTRFVLAAASFGVALLAADHLYNGANEFIHCIIYVYPCQINLLAKEATVYSLFQ